MKETSKVAGQKDWSNDSALSDMNLTQEITWSQWLRIWNEILNSHEHKVSSLILIQLLHIGLDAKPAGEVEKFQQLLFFLERARGFSGSISDQVAAKAWRMLCLKIFSGEIIHFLSVQDAYHPFFEEQTVLEGLLELFVQWNGWYFDGVDDVTRRARKFIVELLKHIWTTEKFGHTRNKNDPRKTEEVNLASWAREKSLDFMLSQPGTEVWKTFFQPLLLEKKAIIDETTLKRLETRTNSEGEKIRAEEGGFGPKSTLILIRSRRSS